MPGFSTFCPATDCACCQHSVPQCPHSSLSNATVLQVMHVCLVVSLSCPTLQPHGLWTARLLCSWNFPGKNTGLPFPSDLPDPEINLHLSHLLKQQVDSLPLVPRGENVLVYVGIIKWVNTHEGLGGVPGMSQASQSIFYL